ncbi:DUF1289 domain-containing protein [Ferrovibrio sp.]|uniref:DUF1289 domain-containing protein n=1 Tax=Ferrovibrio sp. TaxID=1917215 RepID=UPI00311F9AA3
MDRPDPPSPCNKVCQIDRRTGWCLGCGRSGAEIGAWPGLDAAGKRALLDELARRPWQRLPAGRRAR